MSIRQFFGGSAATCVAVGLAVTGAAGAQTTARHASGPAACRPTALRASAIRDTFGTGNVWLAVAVRTTTMTPCVLPRWATVSGEPRNGPLTPGTRESAALAGVHPTGRRVVLSGRSARAGLIVGGSEIARERRRCGSPYHHVVIGLGAGRPLRVSAFLHSLRVFLPACARLRFSEIVPRSRLGEFG